MSKLTKLNVAVKDNPIPYSQVSLSNFKYLVEALFVKGKQTKNSLAVSQFIDLNKIFNGKFPYFGESIT